MPEKISSGTIETEDARTDGGTWEITSGGIFPKAEDKKDGGTCGKTWVIKEDRTGAGISNKT